MNLRPNHLRQVFDDPVHGRMNGHTTEKSWSCTVLPAPDAVALEGGDQLVRVVWDDNADTASAFRITLRRSGSPQEVVVDEVVPSELVSVDGKRCSWLISGLESSESYDVTVAAIRDDGAVSSASVPFATSVTTNAGQAVPTGGEIYAAVAVGTNYPGVDWTISPDPLQTPWGNGTVTIDVTGLPRHTFGKMHIAINTHTTGGVAEGLTFTVQAGTFSGTLVRPGGTGNYWTVDGAPATEWFEHVGASMPITITASGFPTDPSGGHWSLENFWLMTGLPTVSVVAEDDVATEGADPADNGTFRFERSGPGQNRALVAHYDLSGSATNGQDYELLDGGVVFPPGETSTLVDVVPVDDDAAEWAESLTAVLHTNTSYLAGPSTLATIRTLDDDLKLSGLPSEVFANWDDDDEDFVVDADGPGGSHDDDLYPIQLHFPIPTEPDQEISLHLEGGSARVWLDSARTGAPVISPSQPTATWRAVDAIPSQLFVEVLDGATTVNALALSLAAVEPGAATQPATTQSTPLGLGFTTSLDAANPHAALIGSTITATRQVVAPVGLSSNWSFDGGGMNNVIKSFRTTETSGGPVAIPADELDDESISFVFPNAGKRAVSIAFKRPGKPDEVVKRVLDIRAPTWNPTGAGQPVIGEASLGVAQGTAAFGLFANRQPNGISVTGTVATPVGFPAGQTAFLSIISPARRCKVDGRWFRQNFYGQVGLDGRFPYTDTFAADGVAQSTFTDSPHTGTEGKQEIIVDREVFETTLMFRPDGGTWVPLRSWAWWWGGHFTAPETVADPEASVQEVASNFPAWDKIIKLGIWDPEVPQ